MLLVHSPVACARTSQFELTGDARGYRVEASADIEAEPALVWATLTDYEGLPGFVPGISSVRVRQVTEEAGRRRLLVEQSGELRFLFFSRRVAVLLDVDQQPMTRVHARALPRPQPADGDESALDDFEGTYTLVPIAGGVRLAYRARFAPGFALPPLLGRLAIRRTMQAQFEAMLEEIERRRRAPAPQGPAR